MTLRNALRNALRNVLRNALRNALNVTTRADALVVRVEHWTPEGDCTERGDKERSDQKKVHQKNYEIFSQKASLAVM